MKYHFKIHKENGGYWAECIELQGCVTQADTLEELNQNMQDALNLYIEEPERSKDLAAMPDDTIKLTKNIVEVPVDPFIGLGFLIRSLRIKSGLTQKKAAEKMGFKELYSYQRLESGKSNPTFKILFKIKSVFPDFSIDQVLNSIAA